MQGLNIIEAAEATEGLEHFVMQSMHRGGQPPLDETVLAPIHHRAKWELEDALSGSSLPWSVLRQPIYLENFANDEDAAKGTQLRLLKPGSVSGLLAEQVSLTVIGSRTHDPPFSRLEPATI